MRREFDLNTLLVDGKIFESGKKKSGIQTNPDTCRRALGGTTMNATRTTPSKRPNDQNSVAVHLNYKSLYICLPSSTKQERQMTKFHVVLRNANEDG